ncbi:hypothetical protein, partial [Bradyrhizobium elkanii]
DNVFVERLWRSVKYEEVYLRAYDTVSDARASMRCSHRTAHVRGRKSAVRSRYWFSSDAARGGKRFPERYGIRRFENAWRNRCGGCPGFC